MALCLTLRKTPGKHFAASELPKAVAALSDLDNRLTPLDKLLCLKVPRLQKTQATFLTLIFAVFCFFFAGGLPAVFLAHILPPTQLWRQRHHLPTHTTTHTHVLARTHIDTHARTRARTHARTYGCTHAPRTPLSLVPLTARLHSFAVLPQTIDAINQDLEAFRASDSAQPGTSSILFSHSLFHLSFMLAGTTSRFCLSFFVSAFDAKCVFYAVFPFFFVIIIISSFSSSFLLPSYQVPFFPLILLSLFPAPSLTLLISTLPPLILLPSRVPIHRSCISFAPPNFSAPPFCDAMKKKNL
jgi:hypothetical protein